MTALMRLEILDSDPEPTFDAITRVAAALFDVPIATITFIDAERQWFKSKLGLAVTETPRAIAFCAHTIAGESVFTVGDTLRDPRFADNPLVTGEPRLRFYAGAPLVLPSGARVGTISIMDRVPHALDDVAKGHLARLAHVVVDAVEQRLLTLAAQRAQAASQQLATEQSRRQRAILDAALDAIVMADSAGAIVDVNPAFEAMFCIARADAVGRSMTELIVPPAYRERHDAAWARYLATGETHVLGRRVELSAVDRTLREFPIELVAIRLPEEPPLFAAFIRDLTAQRKIHADLVHSQKLDAVGRLAGGIAHDFNNNLAVVLGYVDAARIDRGDPVKIEEDLVEITRAVERAAELTRHLLSFSRQLPGSPVSVDLNDLLRALGRMLARVITKSLALEWQLHATRPLQADRGSVEQMIMNLVINARDAMPNGGTLTIATADADADGDPAGGDVAVTAGRWVKVVVADTGCGMAPAVSEKIFEPFFTTKTTGSGLGLSVVFGTIKQLGGTLRVRSNPGAGSAFELYFPASDAGPAPADQGDAGTQRDIGPRERVD